MLDIDRPDAATRAAMKAQTKMQERDLAGLEYLLSDERGRWLVMRLFERCHMMSTTFPPTDDTGRMLIYEGERRVALGIKDNIVRDADRLQKLQLAEREYRAWMTKQEETVRALELDKKQE